MECPKCSSRMIRKVHRSFSEKLLITSKKYKCYACKKEFLIFYIFGKVKLIK